MTTDERDRKLAGLVGLGHRARSAVVGVERVRETRMRRAARLQAFQSGVKAAYLVCSRAACTERLRAMDDFTLIRITRFIGAFKKDHGRDPAHADLEKAGFANADIDHVVRRGAVDKYHATTGTGARENRYKLHRDWRSLRSD